MEVDEALAKVGGLRRWHIGTFALMSTTALTVFASQNIGIVFLGLTGAHHCTIPESQNLNETLPWDEKKGAPVQCFMYEEIGGGTNATTSCTNGWTYEREYNQNSFVMEFDLVCDKSMWPEVSQAFFQVGGILGELTASILSDIYGRKWVHILSYFFIIALGVGLSYAQDFLTFIIVRSFVAVFTGAAVNVAFTHLFELFDSDNRGFVGVGCEYFWSFAYFFTCAVGYFVRDWRQFQMIISLCAICGFLNVCVLESPMWLLANHRDEEAESNLQKMAKYNGVDVQGKLLKQEQDDSEKQLPLVMDNHKSFKHRGSKRTGDIPSVEMGNEVVWDLFRFPLLLKYTLVSSFLWFTNCLVYYFLILATPSLLGDFYLNVFLGGVAEIPGFLVASLVIRHSRRLFSIIFHILAGACLIALAFVPVRTASGTDLSVLVICIALLGKFAICTTFSIIVLYTREYFPTNLRGTASGVCNVLGRAGNTVAPFASYIAKSAP